jgi:hypothetical protein
MSYMPQSDLRTMEWLHDVERLARSGLARSLFARSARDLGVRRM